MDKIVDISNCDVFFLSYDEPNADENYSQILQSVPWAERVHGVKGSDTAHKEVAKNASTKRVVIIDGDNFLTNDRLLEQEIIVSDDSINLDNSVFSWPSKNLINGLLYGNGGIKCWPTELILNIKTHEHAPKDNIKAQIDFCWDVNYIALDDCYAEIRNNSTPYQAWRAGFREGVKMSLDQGVKVDDITKVWWQNYQRLLMWMTVGADIENGLWSILGARQGCYMTMCTDWNYINVRDFDHLNNIWEDISEKVKYQTIDAEIDQVTLGLSSKLRIPEYFDNEQSKLVKQLYINPLRQPTSITVRKK